MKTYNLDQFISESDNDTLKNLRYSFWLILLFLCLYGFVEPLLVPERKESVLLIRFGFIVPVILGCCILSHLQVFARIKSVIVMISSLTVIIGLSAIVMQAPQNDLLRYSYTLAMVIAVSFAPTLLTFQFAQGVSFSIGALACYNFYFFRSIGIEGDTNFAMFLSTNALLVIASILGVFTRMVTYNIFLRNLANLQVTEEDKNMIEKQLQLQIQMTEELVESKKKLSHSFEVKNRLLSLIAHDIRGPLASVAGIVELFNRGLLTKEELTHHSRNLTFLLHSANNLLSNILSWSILNMEDNFIAKERVNLNKIVCENFQLVSAQASSKKNELINSVPESLYALADPSVLSLVFRNLISNAIKFTENGKIEISAFIRGRDVIVNIADTGVGIHLQDITKLFNWGERQSSLGTRSEKGSGIGLPISRDIMEKHGGELLISSTKHSGTIASVILREAL